MSSTRRIAVVGAGISGLAAAYALGRDPASARAEVVLFEAGSYFGGHTNTVEVCLPGPHGALTHGVDTGFLVFNERTYPQLIELFAELDVATAPSEMSFSVQVPEEFGAGKALEWSGSDLNSVFAQRANLLRPRFWYLLREILRFNRLCTALAEAGDDASLRLPIGDFLSTNRFSETFCDWYFLPMIGCIWSCPTEQMLRFPVGTMIRFCHNHGLIQVSNRPRWYTVRGGARHYVEKMLAQIGDARVATPVEQVRRRPGGVQLSTAGGTEHFDQLVLACHSDQALALLADATPQERAVLGAIRYQPNRAVLHTDASVMPSRKRAWAAWNYERAASDDREQTRVCLHYWLNRLQPLPFTQDLFVTLNPVRPLRESAVIGRFDYEHPVFDLAAVEAQRRLPTIQGRDRTWFCGAWTGYGFHEDGLRSGLQAASAVAACTSGHELQRSAA
ncbi:NAD(P)/FAD-dependent oxidoreductase [Rivibacter subsaxonicus]|uniref:Putative NAD/FAD-binding protein n=1 Tax=Rivibacter subsaxonicus TaxID=457575 RepID=A0A4Q7VVF6_9BURK|nr:FAD-dependent oxidoreductase [Rivibacter subsaxonicus]RZU00647.1 putative NAD/FAD-binding protein [Rivibacter subsaxonicus]